MSTLTVIATVLYTLVVLTLIGNFIRLFVDSKKLKAEGKTPLIGRTSVTIIVAAIAETLFVFVAISLYTNWHIAALLSVAISFASMYLGRSIASYLVTWGTWSLFVRHAKKKEIEKIQQEVNKGTSQN